MGPWKVSATMVWIFSLCQIRLSCASQNTAITALFGSFGQLAVDIRAGVQPDAVSLMQIGCRSHPRNPHGKIGNVSGMVLIHSSRAQGTV